MNKLKKLAPRKYIPGDLSHINLQKARDVFQAKRKNLDWTDYRPFISALESGKSPKCDRCQKPGEYVSYSVKNDSKNVLCVKCHESWLKKRQEELDFLSDGSPKED